jgi:Uma2 family endonuclease
MTQAIIATPETANNSLATEASSEEKLLWTSADLELMPDNYSRYEIINGELYVTRAPHNKHQDTCGNFHYELKAWSKVSKLGYSVIGAGLILGDSDDVIPDVIWMSKEKYTDLIDDTGHFRGAPELVIEVLSAGTDNVKRDCQVKLKLYSNHGVLEYWIADWRAKQIQVYRRENGVLKLVMTLFETDTLTSPLLPEFSCLISQIFA